MVGKDLDAGSDDCKFPNVRKAYWRSATWNVHTGPPSSSGQTLPVEEEEGATRVPPQTPRSQGHNSSIKSRVPLLPLQPLSIVRKSFDDWPSAGLDDAPDLISPLTPGRRRVKAGIDIKLDLASVHRSVVEPTEIQLRRDKFALFDKQCSRVANYHIYLGSDAVARDREILRANGMTHVLNCVGFVCPEYFKEDLIYKTLWLQDSPGEDITSLLYDVFDYFEEIREQGGRVFVHCCQGVSRSTSLVIAYLMWREHSSFEEAFQDVKAARGVANPNMGFACQLLQLQKRVNAAPMSPKSSLRMYRLAPHSPYDPLHLVPKASTNPGAGFLDSRGAFVIQMPCAVIVWVGQGCDAMMARAAEEAAYQIIRYERATGPVKILLEGYEGVEFWESFKNFSQQSLSKECAEEGSCPDSGSWAQNSCRNNEDEVERFSQLGVGNRKVTCNDFDYNLYRMARRGGVIPPVSFSSAAVPTSVPVREDGWSILRRKVLSRELAAANQKSSSERAITDDLSPNLSMGSSSPLFSPFSVTSVSSCAPIGSESPFGSPFSSMGTLSPFTPSENVKQAPSCARSSHWFVGGLPIVPPPTTLSKSPASSLAQRRGSAPPVLRLPNVEDVPPPAPREASRKPKLQMLLTTRDCRTENAAEELEVINLAAARHVSLSTSSVQFYDNIRDDQCKHDLQIGTTSAVAASNCSPSAKSIPEVGFPFLYLWPGLERIDMLDKDDLDTRAVFLLVDSGCQSSGKRQGFNVHVWVGRQLAENKENPNESSSNDNEALWHQVGLDFVERMRLPENVSVNVVREGQEPEEFWNALNQG